LPALQAFCGAGALGVVAVADVPEVHARRAALLPLARDLAHTPPESLHKYEDRESLYNVGWSLGKEVLQSGVTDSSKASFYANPLRDTPGEDMPPVTNSNLQQLYPSEPLPNAPWSACCHCSARAAFRAWRCLQVTPWQLQGVSWGRGTISTPEWFESNI
jgi:hypothetical protein